MKELKFSNAQAGAFCRELGFLMHAGISTGGALATIAQDETDPALRKIFNEMVEGSDGGKALSIVMREAGCFEETMCAMVEVGEATGKTETALSALAESYDNHASIDRSLKSALLYPAILFLIMLAAVAVLLMYVLPIFNEVYAQLGSSLTGLSGALLGIGKGMKLISPLLAVLLAGAVAFLALFSGSDAFRQKVLKKYWSAKGDRGVAGKLGEAGFAQALSLCLSSGIKDEEAVETAAGLIKALPGTEEKTSACIEAMKKGESLPSALRKAGLLPASHCRILEAGTKSGAADTAMAAIAAAMSEEADFAIEESVSKIEPAMVIAASIMIGIILISVMLPLVNIMAAIG